MTVTAGGQWWAGILGNQAWNPLQFNDFVSAKLSGINILSKAVAISLNALLILSLLESIST